MQEQYGPHVANVRRIGAGAWSQAYAFTLDGAERVIRWSRFADNFERDAFAARFRATDLPIPDILVRSKVGEQFYAISPFVPGDYLERLGAADLQRTLPSLLRTLRAYAPSICRRRAGSASGMPVA